MYVIIDIETTGGKFNQEGITEIAIYKFDGHTIVDQFSSLINPERPIQPFVVKLTGITDKMVRTAPKFHEVAKRIVEITDNCVFVAHNTSFDYRIIRTEFSRLGYDYTRETLCTVELSKKLIPDLPSYSLGKLCKSLGIPSNNRHRAAGDAFATVKLFELLLSKDIDKEITKTNVKKIIDKVKVLSNKITGMLDELPSSSGIYYVHDIDGTVLYIGKNKNICHGANALFLKNSKKSNQLQNSTESLSYDETGNELIAEIIYLQTLHKIKPKFNIIRKRQIPTVTFNSENMLLIDKGRHTSEKSILLIENNELVGYGFIDLQHQIENLEIVKNIITPLEDNLANRNVVKKYLTKKRVEKIVRF